MKKSITFVLLVLFCICGYAQNMAITLTSNPTNAGTLSGGGNYQQGQTCTITATAKTNYAFANWTKDGTVVSSLPTYSFTVTESAQYVANFKPINGIVVGGATGTNNVLPTYTYSKYALTQQIYTASEMGGQSCQIVSVSFYNTTGSNKTRNLAVYLVSTDKTAFGSTNDWIAVNNATNLMFSGSVTFEANGWTTIYFNNPFFYNGYSNVALVVDDNTGSQDYGTGLSCRSYDADGYQALRIYSSSSNYNYNPTNPTFYGTRLTVKNQVIFGRAQYNITVSASANPNGGGSVGGGTGLHYYGQPVTLTAAANSGYVFSNWTKNGEVVSYLSTYTFPATETAHYVANFEEVEGIAIGNADTVSTYLPIYSRNPYGLSQQIYTAAEMGTTPHEISSVSFFNTGPSKNRSFAIYLVETSKTAFESQTDWIVVSEDDKVFSGNVTFSSNDWTTVNFNKVFNYDGSSNVAMIIDNNNYSWDYGAFSSFRTFNTSGNQALHVYSSTNIDPADPSNFTGTLSTKKNQVIFGFPNYIYTVTATVSPEGWGSVSGNEDLFFLGQSCTLTATATTGHYFLNWTKNGSTVSSNSTYTFVVNGDTELVANFVEPIMITTNVNPEGGGTTSGGGEYGPNQTCTLTATPNEGYVFSRWTKNGSVVSCLPTYNFTVSTSSAGEYVANFLEVENGIAVGEPTSSNSYLPTYCYSPFSMTQQIYTADELNMESGQISSVSFFSTYYGSTRNLTIYMVNTNKTAFNGENDWIPVSGTNLVFSGSVSMPYRNWFTIYFIAPFIYDGSSNIALIVDDNTGTQDYSINFRTCATESTQALRINGEENYDPRYPTTYSGTLMSVKNQIILGFPNYEYTASVIAEPEEGGSVIGGGGLYYYGQPIPVTAEANEGYVFNYWTKPNDYYGYDEVVSCLSPAYLPVNGNMEYKGHFQEMDGLIVGEPKRSNPYLPVNEYPYSMTQQIYTADELGTGACEISSLSFFNAGYSYYESRNLTFYLVNTDKTSFNGNTDWIEVTDADMVYSGEIYWNEKEWTTFYFDTPFNYDGSSNLALVVLNESGLWEGELSLRTFDTQSTQAIYVVDEENPIDLGSAVGTLLSEKNQIVFGVASYDYTVTVSADPAEGGTVSGGGGLYYYGQPVHITATPNPGYVFDYWTKTVDDYGYIYDETVSYLSTDDIPVTDTTEFVAHFEQMDGIIIGEAAKINQNLPVYYSYYSMSQQIFTAEEMNAGESAISSVSFFNTDYDVTRNLEVYLVNTDKSAFDGPNDWIAVTEADLRFSGEITMVGYGWSTIYFATPFNYDGSSNVALVINDKTGSWGSELYCRTFDTQSSQAIYVFGSDDSFDPTDPSGYTGELLTEKNQVVFGIASYEYEITVSANPDEGGTAYGGGELYYYGQPIPLSATTNEGYAFSNWTKDSDTYSEVVSCFPDFTLSVTETAEYVANFKEVDGILIGEPSHASSNLPSYYYNSLTQEIYTAAELGRQGQPCMISSVSFFNAGSSRTRNIDLYLVHTDKTAFESNNDWIAVTENDTVLYSGSFNFQAKRWTTIYFTKPFYYDGSSNVALILDDNTNSYYYYSDAFRCRTFDTDDTQVLRISGYQNSDFDPYNPDSYTGSRFSVKNQVIFGYAHYDYMVTASANPTEGGEVEGDTGLHYYGRPVTLTATANQGYVFNKWTKNGEVVSYFSTCNFPVTETAEYVAEFQEMEGIAIGDAVATHNSLPGNTYYYSMTQQIYTAAEMGGAACPISSVSFFHTGTARTRNYAIYMVHTDKTTFESNTDWITVTEDDMVFNGSVTYTAGGWTTINFNEVFNYDGLSNLALIVDDNSGTFPSGLTCRVFNADGNQALCVSNPTNFDPYNPTQYTGTRYSLKNQVVFGSPSYNYTVTTSVNPADGGTASGGGEGYFLGQLCTLTATANPNYSFYNWTLDGTVVSLDNPYTFPVTGNMELVANFGTPINVTVSANPTGGGTVSGGGGYGYNHQCTVTATANPGYVFTKWTKNGSVVSYLSTYNFTVTAATECVAHFEQVNNGVAVGDAVYANYNYHLPYSYYPYSLSQQIYTADELNIGACQIASLSLFNTNSSPAHKLTIYMVNTTKSSFDSETDWITVTEADKVFEGSFTSAYHEWSTLYFNTPFYYDGTSNIALIVDDNTNEWTNTIYVRSFDTESTQAIRIYGSEVNYDPYHPTIYTGTRLSVKNQIIFGFPTYGYNATVSANPQEGGTVSGGGGYYFYGQNIPISATPNYGYVFNNWTKNGNVVSYLSTDNVSVTETAEYVANFQPMQGMIVGLPVSTNQYLPTYGYDHNMTQQIYTAAEMGGTAAQISSVSFFNTESSRYRYLDVYMVHTDKTSFANSTDWITVTEADKLYSSNSSIIVTGYGWTTIYFSTPFDYDGESNVALVVVDNTNTYSTGLRCRTFETNERQAIYTYISDSNIDPCYPAGYNGTLLREKNQVVFGTASFDYTVTISVDPVEGGTIVSGAGQCYYGQPLSISVTANPGYVFNNWTKYNSQYGYDEEISYLSTDVVSVTESTEYVAHFQQTDDIIIGEAIHSNQYLPTPYSNYSMSQQIYTADEMNADECEISSVSFFNTSYGGTRNLEVYMVNTSKEAFGGPNDWIAVTEGDMVFSGSVSFTGYNWVNVYFDTPFQYDGSSNVALVINDKSGQGSTRYCRTFDTQSAQAMYVSRSTGVYDPCNPFGYNGNLLTQKNQVVLGIAEYQYTVTVSADPEEGGTVTGAGGPYYYGKPIQLSATTNDGYVFSTWKKGNEVVSCFPDFTLAVTETAEYVANFKQVDGILIGEPAHANSYLPTYYHNCLTQQIYTSTEMGGVPCQISSVSFFNTGNYSKTRNLDIYMVHTDKTAFESNTDWIAVTATDTVLFSGSINFPGKSWVTIYFAKPFYYDGSSNVALIVDDNSNSSNYAEIRCRTFDTENTQVLRVSTSANTNYDPYNPTNYTGTLLSVKNEVIFGYAQYGYTINATANPAAGGMVEGLTGSQYYGRPITLTATANQGFVFNNWTKNGEVTSYFSTYSFSVTESADFVANFQMMNGRVIGDAVSQSYSLPSNPYYYSLSQQIYTAAEMGNVAQAISSVSFFNTGSTMTRKFDIYLVHTNKTAFDNNTDWIIVTEADKVFSGNVDFTVGNWTTINFNKVFNYDGTSNVVLIVDDNTNTYSPSLNLRCRTFNTEGNQALYVSYYNTNFDPCNPITSSGTLALQKNQIVFGYPSYVYSVTAMASPAEGGTVSGGGSGYFLGQTCTVTATASSNYRFYNWTMNGYVVSYDAIYTFPVTGNMLLVANFGAPVNVTVSANPEEGGTVTGAGGYGLNQPCTLTATANPGYMFTKWTKGTSTSGLSYLNTYTVTVTEATNYVARFEQINNGVVIGEAEATNNYLPTYVSNYYSLSQQIYTAAEMGSSARQISSVSFFNAGSSSTRNITVYMKQTTKSAFADDSDWIAFSDADKVFSGSVYFRSHEKINIYFDTPFSYDGSSNVVLIVDDNTGSNDYGTQCRSFATTGNQAIRVSSSNTNYDSSNLVGVTGTLLSEKNQVVFGNASYDYMVILSASPTNGGTVSGGGGPYYLGQPCTVTATPNTNAGYCFYYWRYNGASVSTDAVYTFRVMNNMNLTAVFGSPIQITATAGTGGGGTVTGGGEYGHYHTCTLTATPDPGYVFIKWMKTGSDTPVSYYSTYSFTVYNAADYVAVFELVYPDIVVGEAESSSTLPSSSNYYTLSQQIYTADEIGMAGEIHSVSFFSTNNNDVTRNYSIYMKHTNKTFFGSSYEWVSISETDQVFSGNVTMTKGCWTEITFDTPFQYNGVSNIVLVVNDITGTYGNTSCRVFHTESHQATSALTNSHSLDPCNTSYYGNRSTSKNQVIFGFTPSPVTQTITLVEGWNWFSTYIEADDLLQQLEVSLGENGLYIESSELLSTEYLDGEWIGDLDEVGITNEQMYLIQTSTACTIQLQGMIANPINHVITINPEWNWVGYPCTEEMTIAEALANFVPEEGDRIENMEDYAEYLDGEWLGLETLKPGQGFLYYSNSTTQKTFTFPISAK